MCTVQRGSSRTITASLLYVTTTGRHPAQLNLENVCKHHAGMASTVSV